MYDGNTTASITGRTLSGVIGGDDVNYVGGTATFVDRNAGIGKTVAATGLGLSGADAGNYTVNATATTVADIAPRAITVAAAAGQTKIYGDADPLPFGYSVTSGNLVAGDSVSGALSRIAGENVGAYPITQNTLTAGSNYNLAFVSNAFAITPATLSYIATRVSIDGDARFPTFGGTVDGFKGSDTLTSATSGTLVFATTAADASQIGAYAIDGSGLSANAGNYVFAQDPANATALTITPRVDDGALDGLVGAITSALQAEGACVGIAATWKDGACVEPAAEPAPHAAGRERSVRARRRRHPTAVRRVGSVTEATIDQVSHGSLAGVIALDDIARVRCGGTAARTSARRGANSNSSARWCRRNPIRRLQVEQKARPALDAGADVTFNVSERSHQRRDGVQRSGTAAADRRHRRERQ